MSKRTYALAAVVCTLVAIGVSLTLALTRDHGGEAGRPTPGPDGFAERFAEFKAAPEPNGDPTKVDWPKYITANPEVKRLYEFQITHGDLMRYMPCFCGCGGTAGHRNNRDCFVRRVNPDGSVVLDPMGPT